MSGFLTTTSGRPCRGLVGLTLLASLAAASCASKFDVEQPEPRRVPLQDRLAPDDGSIVAVVEATVTRPYDALPEGTQARFDPETWEQARTALSGRADLVTYASDGLRVGGFLVRPEGIGARRVGAVVVNRDGIADMGLDEEEILVELSRYAAQGYVAATSAYRGNRLSQGVDEVGGADVDDVLSMVMLLQRLDYVDPSRIFMVGFGRGGLMTLRALEEGAPVRAAAVISPYADLRELAGLDPRFEAGFAEFGGWPGLAQIHTPWEDVRQEELQRRSPRARAGDLTVPLLIVHGRQNEVVPVAQAQFLAGKMRQSGTPFEAILYGYGDHPLVDERADWQARVLQWIERHDSRAMFN